MDLEWGCTNFTLLGIEFSTNRKNKKVGEDMEQQIFDPSGQDYGHQD